MTPVKTNGQGYQFYFSDIDVHVLVENRLDAVVVRASSFRVSERRKVLFIRYLAAEGHIPDQYQWFAETSSDESSRVRWLVDCSWLSIPPELTRRTTLFMRRLMMGAGLLMLTTFILIFARSR